VPIIAFLPLAWFAFAPSPWTGLTAGLTVASVAVLSFLGWKMYVEGKATLEAARGNPLAVLRAYVGWCREQARPPVWLFAVLALWAGALAAAAAQYLTRTVAAG